MSDDQNASAAAGGDDTPALSIDDAVAVMNGGDEQREEKQKPEGDADLSETDDPADEAEPSDEEESPSESAKDDDEPEDETDADEEVHGNAKTRLRDGTVVAVADLKKAYGELQDLKRQTPEITAQRQEIDQVKADVQKRQKVLDDALPFALHIVQSQIPDEPDVSLRETDPIEFFTQQSRRAEAIERLQKVSALAKQQQADQQEAQEAEFNKFVADQREKLVEKRPELKEPEKAKAFYEEFVKVGSSLGFSKDELDNTHDHRLITGVMALAEKAAKWDNLQASKPKVAEKAKDAVPVQQPGRRKAPSEQTAAQTDELSKRLSKSGSLDDAVALLNKLNP